MDEDEWTSIKPEAKTAKWRQLLCRAVQLSTRWILFIVVELKDLPGSTISWHAAHRWSELAVFSLASSSGAPQGCVLSPAWDKCVWPSFSLKPRSKFSPWASCSPVSLRIQWLQLRFHSFRKLIQRTSACTLQIEKNCVEIWGREAPILSSLRFLVIQYVSSLTMIRMADRQKVRILISKSDLHTFKVTASLVLKAAEEVWSL